MEISCSLKQRQGINLMLNKLRILFLFGGILASVAVYGAQERRNTNTVDLAFFRMIEDKAAYEKSREKFELVTASDRKGSHQIIVERVASFRIASKEIRSVRVSKQKTYSSASSGEEIAKDSTTPKVGKKPSEEVFPHGFVYRVTFSLNEAIAKSFSVFANNHERQRFDLRLGNNRIGTVQFIGRFEVRSGQPLETTTYLETSIREKAEQILSPLRDKITWE